ncbi:hypothetical protein DYB35_012796 [Aphanomyces astaci]|uniref:Peptidase M14 domain-containing protein n=1 Tax=Aphanomyces astaci TaxID=112090 RepID=A0A418CIA0_APHAT|nr:hypothetical protein DYB35_012796 [Aphanomyces astaci]
MRVLSATVVVVLALTTTASHPASRIRDIDNVFRSSAQVRAIRDDADTNRKCHTSNAHYLPLLQPGQYAANAFHNCFRTSKQIFQFVDTLISQNTNLLTKFPVSKTFQGQTIYGYKLSTNGGKEQSFYYQSLLHAREWIAGSSNLFALSSILDDIAANKTTATDLYDLVFVPIANIDGYDMTWSGNRYQRKNANQVDLNRNWPSFYQNPKPPGPSEETYPGPSAFSEPETKGIADWLKSNNHKIAGWVDIHAYAGLDLYPYGDTLSPIGGGEDEKFQLLGRNIQAQMGSNYKAETSATMYPAYGSFDDYHYRTYKKPVLTFEIAGSDFVAPASTIRTRGTEVYKGLLQFAKEMVEFNGGRQRSTSTPNTANPTIASTKHGCATCSRCYYPDRDICLSDFAKNDCDYYTGYYGTLWCGN